MSNKNPTGALTNSNPEWGSKARKEYDHLKGINHQADRQNIEEQLADIQEGIRAGVEQAHAGNTRPAREVFAELGIDPDEADGGSSDWDTDQ